MNKKEESERTITLYTSTNCQICEALKQKLKCHNLKFIERNIEEDQDAFADVLMLGRWVMPVLTLGGRIVEFEELIEE